MVTTNTHVLQEHNFTRQQAALKEERTEGKGKKQKCHQDCPHF